MNIEDIREYCLKKKAVTESFPFDETTLVFKVNNKMFALLKLEGELYINLKCDPQKAIDLRERYDYVRPGFHMNKRLWNSVYVPFNADEKLIKEWIDDSYTLVVKKMSKKAQLEILGKK